MNNLIVLVGLFYLKQILDLKLMKTKFKYLFLTLIISWSAINQAGAQTAYQTAEPGFLSSTNFSFESEVHQSILALKKAEAYLEDTVVANQLERIGYLAIVQSGFSATKEDINQRAGYWMLPYPVAIKYGLRINSSIDERKNLAKSTKAAYLYWKDLCNNYESEQKAELVFIESPIAVVKYEIDSINNKQTFEKLKARGQILLRIKKIYQESNINHIGPEMQLAKVSSLMPISFSAIHYFTKIRTNELQKLNPQWINNEYNPWYGTLNIPVKYKATFKEHLSKMEQKTKDEKFLQTATNTKRIKELKGNIPDLKTHKPIRYKVKSGDNLGRIAQRYHVKISSIRAWNELSSDRIYAGQKLAIYVRNNQKIASAKEVKKETPKIKKPALQTGSYQEYTVKSGDTLWGISQIFKGISADMIMEDNGIGENISPGQILKIRKAE